MRNSFTKLRHALELREKLLLRQIEVLSRAPENKIDFSEISFQVDGEEKVISSLRNYGAYQNIDCFLPYLENENEDTGIDVFEKSFYDPMDNKKLSESIINLTLQESQKLITKSTNLVTSVCDKLKVDQPRQQEKVVEKLPCLHGNDDVKSIKPKSDAKVDESKLKRNDTTTSSKKKTLKNISNLTLNNCGSGSIVLKNISNLTINTCKQSQANAKLDDPTAPPKSCKTSKSCDGSFYQCDFYERLISENEVLKRSIVNQSLCTTYPDPIARTCMSPPAYMTSANKDNECNDGTYSINSGSPEDTSTSSIMEEAEDGLPAAKNEKAMCSTLGFDPSIEEITTRTMMADNLMNHPPMIQCWLNKMLLETETETQNLTEFLEISNIM